MIDILIALILIVGAVYVISRLLNQLGNHND